MNNRHWYWIVPLGLLLVGLSLASDAHPAESVAGPVVTLSDSGEDRHFCSGFYVGNGQFVTAGHCLEGKNSVQVTYDNGTKVPAKVVGLSLIAGGLSDFGIVWTASKDLPAAVGLNCDYLPVIGDEVTAFGYPGGVGYAETEGRVVGHTEPLPPVYRMPTIKMTAELAPGSSGGPILIDNEVIGIASAILRSNPSFSFATPIDTVCAVLGVEDDGS